MAFIWSHGVLQDIQQWSTVITYTLLLSLNLTTMLTCCVIFRAHADVPDGGGSALTCTFLSPRMDRSACFGTSAPGSKNCLYPTHGKPFYNDRRVSKAPQRLSALRGRGRVKRPSAATSWRAEGGLGFRGGVVDSSGASVPRNTLAQPLRTLFFSAIHLRVKWQHSVDAMKWRRAEGGDGGETFAFCRSHLFQIKASGGYPSGAQVRARNTQWAIWGTSSQSNVKPATAKLSLCELVVTSKAQLQQHCQINQELIGPDQKMPWNTCGWGSGLSFICKRVPPIRASSAHTPALDLFRSRESEKKSQILGAFSRRRVLVGIGGRGWGVIGLDKLLNWLKTGWWSLVLFWSEYHSWFLLHQWGRHLSDISAVNGSLGKPRECWYWFLSLVSCRPPLPALIRSHVSSRSLPPARVRHALTNRCSATSRGRSYGSSLDFCCMHACGLRDNRNQLF